VLFCSVPLPNAVLFEPFPTVKEFTPTSVLLLPVVFEKRVLKHKGFFKTHVQLEKVL
jgi:hypothetical protein